MSLKAHFLCVITEASTTHVQMVYEVNSPESKSRQRTVWCWDQKHLRDKQLMTDSWAFPMVVDVTFLSLLEHTAAGGEVGWG